MTGIKGTELNLNEFDINDMTLILRIALVKGYKYVSNWTGKGKACTGMHTGEN